MSGTDRDGQRSEAEVQAGTTSDGVEIRDGLAVYTNEWRVGVVDTSRMRATSDGWFDVVYLDGRRVMQNGDRVATVVRDADGRRLVAADVLASERANTQPGQPG